MPKNELPRESLEEKFKKKKLEPRKVSPEEQKSIDKWNREQKEREELVKEQMGERKRKKEFYDRCESNLKPIFEKIRDLVFKNQRSKIISREADRDMPYSMRDERIYYEIELRWGFYDGGGTGSDITESYGNEAYFSIAIGVMLDIPNLKSEHGYSPSIKNKFAIIGVDQIHSPIKTHNLSKKVEVGRMEKIFLGQDFKWEKLVTLDNPDWKAQVEDYILEELKQKKAI